MITVALKRVPLKRGMSRLKRSRLRSGKPLVRRTPLVSGKGERPVGKKVREIVAERSGGRCEIGFPHCEGTASQMAHRVARKAGGRHGEARAENDRASNLVHACWVCHRVVEERPAIAEEFGLRLPEGADPARVPVWLATHDPALPVWLDDEGGWHCFEDAGT